MAIKTESYQHDQILEIQIIGNALTENDYTPLFELISTSLDHHTSKFIINLEQVETLNSMGLNALIKTFTIIRNSGGELFIVNISSKINQVLLLTKLNTVLNIATSLKNALELLNK